MLFVSAAVLLISGCGTYAGSGAYVGATFGSILGSAIGGIGDGPRGSDLGTIIGMAGGAVVGSVIGNAADQRQRGDIDQYNRDNSDTNIQNQRGQNAPDSQSSYNSGSDDSLYNPNNDSDDRIYDFQGSDYTGDYSAQEPAEINPNQSSVEDLGDIHFVPLLEIKNARFVDDNKDNAINRGEVCKLIFEIYNKGNKTLYDVVPTVAETTGNTHTFISPSIHIEQIAPGKGIRYTAIVQADKRLKNGNVKIHASVLQDGNIISKVIEFNIPTTRK